jgi:peptidyl-prolyl cis-trans isomerase D
MLNFMRKHARSWIVKILLGLVIIVFIFYFGSTRGRDKAQSLAIVNDRSITYGEFRQEYQNLIELYRRRVGEAFNDEMIKNMNLKKQVLDSLINQNILLEKALEMNVAVTNEEVRNSIANFPAFQRDGAFDNRLYQQALRYKRMKPEEFENLQKKSLIIAKVEAVFRESAKVSEQEIYDLYRLQNDKINLNVIRLAAKNMRGKVQVDPKEVEKYFTEHGDEFRIPEKLQVRYLTFSGEDFEASTVVSPEEIRTFYDSNRDKFKGPKGAVRALDEVKDRIIAEIRATKGMTRAYDEAKKAHDTIYQEENFNDYVKKHGLKVTETVSFTRNNIPGELRQVKNAEQIFSLKADEISSILSAPKGYYLVKIVARKDSHTPGLDDVRREVEERYIAEESRKLCKKEADSLLDRLKKGEDLKKFVGENGVEITETGFLSPGQPMPEVGSSKELVEAALGVSEKTPYSNEALYSDGYYVILKFKARKQSDDAEWSKQKDALKTILVRFQANEYLQSWLQDTRDTLTKAGKIKINIEPDKL